MRCKASVCGQPKVGVCAPRPCLPSGRAWARGRLSRGGKGDHNHPPPTKLNQWVQLGASACDGPKGGVQVHNEVAVAS